MVDLTPLLPGLSPVQGKAVVARFDGGRLSSEGGLLALREIERRLGLADRLASCAWWTRARAPDRVVHRLAEIIRFRMLMIGAGYEDGNDADALRRDPMFKLALDRLPAGEELCSQSTISRLENLPDRRALLRLGRGARRAVLRLFPSGAEAQVVKDFQQWNGLVLDGVVGPITWSHIHPYREASPTLQAGSLWPVVAMLQGVLKTGFGYAGAIDGIYGPVTEAVVRQYQSGAWLPVTGVMDERTWMAPAGAAGATLESLSALIP